MCIVCTLAQSVGSELSVNIPMTSLELPSPLITLHLACNLGFVIKSMLVWFIYAKNPSNKCLICQEEEFMKTKCICILCVLKYLQKIKKEIVVLFFAVWSTKNGFCKGKCWPIFFLCSVARRFRRFFGYFWLFCWKIDCIWGSLSGNFEIGCVIVIITFRYANTKLMTGFDAKWREYIFHTFFIHFASIASIFVLGKNYSEKRICVDEQAYCHYQLSW